MKDRTPLNLSPEKKELARLAIKWCRMVDDPKNKKKCDKIFQRIWDIKNGKIKIR